VLLLGDVDALELRDARAGDALRHHDALLLARRVQAASTAGLPSVRPSYFQTCAMLST
jgi:hypothetical protein